MYFYQNKEIKGDETKQDQARKSCGLGCNTEFPPYNGPAFCSQASEHKSWGATIQPDKTVQFKLFSYPDAQSVSVEIKTAEEKQYTIPLENRGEGIFQTKLPPDIVKDGDKYRFLIQRRNKTAAVRDPYSMRQNEDNNWSMIYDHKKFKWSDLGWMNGKDSNRITRKTDPKDTQSKGIANLRIYEAHIGTLTPEGTYSAAKKELTKIAREKKFNAVEFMPVENTFGYNWGYDGVDKFAPNHNMGTPDELKELIDHAHKLGLNVIMDIVPNHLGPDTENLRKTGPYISGCNCFGYKFNFEGPHCKHVKDYIINAALNWVVNYHCDGLRVDMTKFMESDYTLKQMVAELNHHSPNAFLIAEDARDNDPRITRPFTEDEKQQNENEHCTFISKIINHDASVDNIGFDSEWDFLFHKQIAASVLDVWDYRIKSMEHLDHAIKQSGLRVKYPMSHDEVGNIDGTRLLTKILDKELGLKEKTKGASHNERAQHAAHGAQAIVESLVKSELQDMPEEQLQEFLTQNNIINPISKKQIAQAFDKALKQHRLAVGKTYSVPGPKMIFQGDESARPEYFKFFRKVSTGYEKKLECKGYEPGEKAYMDSKLGSIKAAPEYQHNFDETLLYTSDLNGITAENPALSSGEIVGTIVHPYSNIHAMHCKSGTNEIFSVSNFSDVIYENNYYIQFPPGKWVEISNTDNQKYGGKGRYLNPKVDATQIRERGISLPEYGMLFFKRVK